MSLAAKDCLQRIERHLSEVLTLGLANVPKQSTRFQEVAQLALQLGLSALADQVARAEDTRDPGDFLKALFLAQRVRAGLVRPRKLAAPVKVKISRQATVLVDVPPGMPRGRDALTQFVQRKGHSRCLRLLALSRLAEEGGPEVTDVLTAALLDRDLLHAAAALLAGREPVDPSPLLEALADKDLEQAELAATALGLLRLPSAVPPLARRLARLVRPGTVPVTGAWRPKLALARALVRALGETRSPTAIPALVRAVGDGHFDPGDGPAYPIASDACFALAAIATPEAIDALFSRLAGGHPLSEYAVEALETLPPDRLRDACQKREHADDSAVRSFAIMKLAEAEGLTGADLLRHVAEKMQETQGHG